MDFGGFLSFLSALGGEFSSNNAFLHKGDVVSLLQGKEFSDVVSSFGSQSSGGFNVGHSGEFLFTLLGDGDGEHGDIVTNDASSNRFSLSFSGSSFSEAFLVLVEEESDSSLKN